MERTTRKLTSALMVILVCGAAATTANTLTHPDSGPITTVASSFDRKAKGVSATGANIGASVASAQVEERRDRRLKQITSTPRINDQDRARESDRITAQAFNSIRVQVRYKKEFGYKYDSGVFAGSGPSSCDAFSVSVKPDANVRSEYLYGIHKLDKMRESNGFYVCDFVAKDLPLKAPIRVDVDLVDHRSLPFEAWKSGSQAQPPPGQQRTIIIVGGRASGLNAAESELSVPQVRAQEGFRTITLTETEPRATLVFEMVYAPLPSRSPNRRRRP